MALGEKIPGLSAALGAASSPIAAPAVMTIAQRRARAAALQNTAQQRALQALEQKIISPQEYAQIARVQGFPTGFEIPGALPGVNGPAAVQSTLGAGASAAPAIEGAGVQTAARAENPALFQALFGQGAPTAGPTGPPPGAMFSTVPPAPPTSPVALNATATAPMEAAPAGEAAAAGKLGWISNALKFQPASLWGGAVQGPVEAGAGRTALGGALGPGTIGRGLGLAGAGFLGGQVAQGITGEKSGTWDDALQYGITGAGVGAGIGSVVPVVGTGLGALAGAGVGALAGALFGEDVGDDKRIEKARDELNVNATKYMQMLGLSGQAQGQIATALTYLAKGKSGDELKAVYTDTLPQLAATIAQQEQQQSYQDQLTKQATARSAALQTYLLPAMQQTTNWEKSASNDYSGALAGAAQYLNDPQLKSAMLANSKAVQVAGASNARNALMQYSLAPQVVQQTLQQQQLLNQAQVPSTAATIAAALGPGYGGSYQPTGR